MNNVEGLDYRIQVRDKNRFYERITSQEFRPTKNTCVNAKKISK